MTEPQIRHLNIEEMRALVKALTYLIETAERVLIVDDIVASGDADDAAIALNDAIDEARAALSSTEGADPMMPARPITDYMKPSGGEDS